jgi:hypothetical protein
MDMKQNLLKNKKVSLLMKIWVYNRIKKQRLESSRKN